jgi:selenocysteine lyase/cysteine desulfurase
MGLPPVATVAAMQADLADWSAGKASAAGYDEAVRRSRAAYARIVGVPVENVAVGSQASVLTGTVAASLPDGAQVLTVAEDFASVQFPFLAQADRGISVRQVPLQELANAVTPSTDVVAFSLVQSADGRVADVESVLTAAAGVGALTVCDVTQAAGWFPVAAARYDVTVCSAYKWLCCPRGSAFLTASPRALQRLRPVNAGWYAGKSVWDSVYGPQMHLAADARRLDVSPAWPVWVGAAPALELLAGLDAGAVHRHDVSLANRLRAEVGLSASDSAIVALDDPSGSRREALVSGQCAVAARAGRVRLSFHLWNDENDVERAVTALRGAL